MSMVAPILETERVTLRLWKKEDFPLFAAMNKDPAVMEFFPSLLTREQSDALAQQIEKELLEKEYGLWALERKSDHSFMGFMGLHQISFEAPFNHCPELGYRLAKPFWGQGFATECGKKIFEYAFKELQIPEIVSFTFVKNFQSRKVMERLGMTHNPDDDFLHPKLPKDHPLRSHVLYRIKKSSYLSGQ